MVRHVPQFFDQALFIGDIEKNIEESRCFSSFLQLREAKLVNSLFFPLPTPISKFLAPV
jgi:hypothetical protein